MVLLSSDEFLRKLQHMYINKRVAGSVTVTMKRYDGIDRPKPTKPNKHPNSKFGLDEDTGERKILIRAKDSKGKKLSTVIDAELLQGFQEEYSKVLRSSMDGLKKRERKRKADQKKKKISTSQMQVS